MKSSLIRGVALAAATLLVLPLAACGDSKTADKAGDEVRILVSVPLSGDSAESGQDMLNGAKLAARYLNENGGVKEGPRKGQEFVVEGADDQLDTQAASTIASRFVSDEKYYGLTGFITSGQAQAAGVVLDKHGLGLVSSYSGANFLTDEADNIVLALAPVEAIPVAMIHFAATDLGAKTAGAISGDFSFLDSYHEGLNSGAKDSGVKIQSQETYAAGTSDFSTLLTRINRENPDVLMSGAFQSDAGKIVAQARKAGMNQPVIDYLGEGWGDSFFEAAGSAATKGDLYASDSGGVITEATSDSIAAWAGKAFEAEYGKSMPSAAAYTFESVLTFAAAIEAGASDRTDFLKYVPKLSGEGFFGPIEFNDDLTPVSRPLFVSKFTGTTPQEKEVKAKYLMRSDGSVERQ